MVGNVDHAALIALGMVGFLAAVTQAPLTAFIIVMEMIDGHAMVLSLMACALIASLVSRLLGPPVYGALAHAQLDRLAPEEPRSLAPDAPQARTGPNGAAPGTSAAQSGRATISTPSPRTPVQPERGCRLSSP